ncbi:MAG: N-acetyltransferase [Salinisphaeraceae bacterium]|jgi:UDP-2-acetamido-3-amino-2,3-dideoxy-glucuronate N-acetyltransferase|nr:N-acetyltransferase [Salinisphaeraceae bacterium]
MLHIHPTACIDDGARMGPGTRVWHFSHVCRGADIGPDCVLGQNVYVGPDVRIGRGVKIQNNVSLFEGVELEDEVFCGPSVVFTNVNNPRAFINRKQAFRTTRVARGATLGANATILCGLHLGAYCLVGAGAVVTRDVTAHALMTGQPARRTGWVSRAGEVLAFRDAVARCPHGGEHYRLVDERLECQEPPPVGPNIS